MALRRRYARVLEDAQCISIWCRPASPLHFCPSVVQLELGFIHAVEIGPTSNFVGNHMTQGAIDLVQAELGQRPSMAKRMQQAQNTVIRAPQPKLLESVPGPPPRLLTDGSDAGSGDGAAVEAQQELGIGPVVVVPGQRPPDMTELRKAVRRQRRR
jgi:hypothetical protein